MTNFSFNEMSRKDLRISLTLWGVMMFISFVMMPLFQVVQFGPRLLSWFWLSLPLGTGGALLLTASSRFVAISHDRGGHRETKSLKSIIGQFGGVLGLVGILFPLLVVVADYLTRSFR
ncbi:MAG: hypothetical protein ACKO24_01495 [Leptolyngbyaceae cyanobacterium]